MDFLGKGIHYYSELKNMSMVTVKLTFIYIYIYISILKFNDIDMN
jgi:hypothetical protein